MMFRSQVYPEYWYLCTFEENLFVCILMCLAPKVAKETGYVKWNEFTCEDIERLWRAIGHRVGDVISS